MLTAEKRDRLWARYWRIRDNYRNGLCMPILWHLALQRDVEAMLELSSVSDQVGRCADPFSSEGLAYRAFKAGSATAAQNLAMSAFNRNDLQGYRQWLAKAAMLGGEDEKRELKRFEIRLPHGNARKIGRKRPTRRYDFG